MESAQYGARNTPLSEVPIQLTIGDEVEFVTRNGMNNTTHSTPLPISSVYPHVSGTDGWIDVYADEGH